MIAPYRYSDLEHYSLTFGIACLSYLLAALAFILVRSLSPAIPSQRTLNTSDKIDDPPRFMI